MGGCTREAELATDSFSRSRASLHRGPCAGGGGSDYVITDRGGVTYLDVLAYCSHESVCLQLDATEGGILKPEVLVQQPQHSSVVEGHAPLQQLHDVIITS